MSRPFVDGRVLENISIACEGKISGGGIFTKKCNKWLQNFTGAKKVLLTHSCTASLEMAALLINIKPGDEIIMPSFTHPSTANAFVLRGGIPVFVDIRLNNLNMNEYKIREAITKDTRAIVPVHYAGSSCNMDVVMGIAKEFNLFVIEDAAQAIDSYYKNKHLGSIGHLGAISFHETKNISAGECGCLLINDERFIEKANIILEFGTNRNKFNKGEVDKYTWVGVGSSYMPSEITASFLYTQLQNTIELTNNRASNWLMYHQEMSHIESKNIIAIQAIPRYALNGHIFYLLVKNRDFIIEELKKKEIVVTSHYTPLHTSPFGRKYYRSVLPNTDIAGSSIIRLPLWNSKEFEKINYVIKEIERVLNG